MAAPTYSAGTPGNVLNVASLAAGKNAAALVDLSTSLGGALHCKLATGATAPTAATTFACLRAYGTGTGGNTTMPSGATLGTTSVTVGSATGIAAGQKVALIAATSGVGEVVTVSSVSGTTLTLAAATTNAYVAGDKVFLVEQTASGGTVAPGSAWSVNSTYSTSLYPPAAWVWIVQATNGDGTNAVGVAVTLDKNPAFA